MLSRDRIDGVLVALGETLAARGLSYELVAAGGSGLLLLGLISRPTRDLDVIAIVEAGSYHKAEPLPAPLVQAVRDVGEALGIGGAWLNAGPADLLDFGLPEGFASRVDTRRYGPLTVHLAGRSDQVAFKLYAAVDTGPNSKHFQDLHDLAPTRAELVAAARWAQRHDPSPGFRSQLLLCLTAFGTGDVGEEL